MSFLFISIAAICNAVMDKTKFHWHKSVFNLLDRQWWDGTVSWKNKYIDGDSEKGRNGKLVWFSDAFHLFKSLMVVNVCLAIVTYQRLFNWWLDFVILGGCWNLVFRLYFETILHRE